MRVALAHFVVGLASALPLLPAWAGATSDNQAILVAPELAVARDGPVTATFLGASRSFSGPELFDFSTPGRKGKDNFTAYSLRFAPSGSSPVPGAQSQTPPLAAGADVTLATFFGIPQYPEGGAYTATGLSQQIMAAISLGGRVIFENAGVVETGPDTVLVGFNPWLVLAADGSFSAIPTPSNFGDFALRIAVSNVCVR